MFLTFFSNQLRKGVNHDFVTSVVSNKIVINRLGIVGVTHSQATWTKLEHK